jgi:hypothetical protein
MLKIAEEESYSPESKSLVSSVLKVFSKEVSSSKRVFNISKLFSSL